MACLWELADKASKGKLPEFDEIMRHQPDGLAGSLLQSGMYVLPIEIFHIDAAYGLPLLHRDPFDRMMIAQAIVEDLIVITADRVFEQYAGLRVLAA
jgi:PIN domain nuclease of toxin-antitoxin system